MNEREFFLCKEKKTSEQAHKVVNPFSGQVEYSTFLATQQQIEEAITKAHAARKTLASTPSYVRKNACLQIASEIKSKKKALESNELWVIDVPVDSNENLKLTEKLGKNVCIM